MVESLPVKIMELQPAFLFKRGLLAEINLKNRCSEVFFKMTVYLKHFTSSRETIRGGVFLLAKF